MKIKLGNNEAFYVEKNGNTQDILATNIMEGDFSWLDLRDMRDNGTLKFGHKYRLIDYRCTVNESEDYYADNHNRFDILLTATANNMFSEDAILLPPIDNNINPSDWLDVNSYRNRYITNIKAKYCIDNDIARFSWANEDGGKGVIYRMIDEYGNDMPFDFIHIMFKRYTIHREENYPLYGAPFFPLFHAYIKSALPNSGLMLPQLSENVKAEILGTDYRDISGTLSQYIVEDSDFVYAISAIPCDSSPASLPIPMNLLLPINPLWLYNNHRLDDGYSFNKHPSNNVIKAKYNVIEIDGDYYDCMILPNITITPDNDNDFIRINNNYFGPDVDNISIYGTYMENNKFNGKVNNVFFGGYLTQNVNITENALIKDVMFMRLANVDIGGEIINSLFLFPLDSSFINGEIYESLIYYTGGVNLYARHINIEKTVNISSSILLLPLSRFSYKLNSLSLRDLYINDSAIIYSSSNNPFGIKLLTGNIEHSYYLLDGSTILNDGIPKSLYSEDVDNPSKNSINVLLGYKLMYSIDPRNTWT